MDQARARALLDEERARLRRLLAAGAEEQEAGYPEDGVGDDVDDADRRNVDETGLAVDQLVRDRWAALRRAEARLDEGEALGPAGHPYEVLDDADITPEEQHAGDEDVDEPPPEPEPGIHVERDDDGRQ